MRRDLLALFVLAGLILAGVVVLLALGRPVPAELWSFGSILLGAVAGAVRPSSSTEPPPPELEPAPVAVEPAPVQEAGA